jgi:hypothetical protein
MWESLTATATVVVALLNPTLGVAQDASVSQKSVPEQIVDAFHRSKVRQVLATLILLLGDYDAVEAALHDAFLVAA